MGVYPVQQEIQSRQIVGLAAAMEFLRRASVYYLVLPEDMLRESAILMLDYDRILARIVGRNDVRAWEEEHGIPSGWHDSIGGDA